MKYNLEDGFTNIKSLIGVNLAIELETHLLTYFNTDIELNYPLSIDIDIFKKLTNIPDPLLYLSNNKEYFNEMIDCEEHNMVLDLKYGLSIKSIDEPKIKDNYLIIMIHLK